MAKGCFFAFLAVIGVSLFVITEVNNHYASIARDKEKEKERIEKEKELASIRRVLTGDWTHTDLPTHLNNSTFLRRTDFVFNDDGTFFCRAMYVHATIRGSPVFDNRDPRRKIAADRLEKVIQTPVWNSGRHESPPFTEPGGMQTELRIEVFFGKWDVQFNPREKGSTELPYSLVITLADREHRDSTAGRSAGGMRLYGGNPFEIENQDRIRVKHKGELQIGELQRTQLTEFTPQEREELRHQLSQ